MRWLITSWLLVLAVAGSARAAPATQEADHSPRSAAAGAEVATGGAAIDETQPVAVPSPTEKALQFHRSGNLLWIVDQAWGVLMLAVILMTGLSARLRDWSQRIGRRWFFTLAIYWILFTIITTVVDHAGESQRGHRVREAADRRAGRAASRSPLYAVARQSSSAAWRAHRLRQRIRPVAGRTARPLTPTVSNREQRRRLRACPRAACVHSVFTNE